MVIFVVRLTFGCGLYSEQYSNISKLVQHNGGLGCIHLWTLSTCSYLQNSGSFTPNTMFITYSTLNLFVRNLKTLYCLLVDTVCAAEHTTSKGTESEGTQTVWENEEQWQQGHVCWRRGRCNSMSIKSWVLPRNFEPAPMGVPQDSFIVGKY